MTIIVDGMGGDNAPLQILKGCAMAVEELGVKIIVTGPQALLKKTMEDNDIDDNGIEIRDAQEVITMDDDAGIVLKAKRNSSMGLGFDLLKNGKATPLFPQEIRVPSLPEEP